MEEVRHILQHDNSRVNNTFSASQR
jgi:hypothetical protein